MNSIARLNNLLVGNWQEIVVQGGEIRKDSRSIYLLSELWIHIDSRWIEISAMEINEDSFSLSVSELNYIPIPEPSKRYYPPRKIVFNFPVDCKLDNLGKVVQVCASNITTMDEDVLCGEFLIIKGSTGKSLKITVSNYVPECIEIMMQ